jgi:DNA-binding NarL/FixJ family response regulator
VTSLRNRIRVLLVDDHQMMRDGLRALLEKEPRVEVVGEAREGKEAVEQVATLAPDVVVMDVALPGMNGVEATRQIANQHPTVKVLALSTYADRRYVENMLKAGARGYVVKVAGCGELVKAVESVHQGKFYLSPDVTDFVVEGLVGPARRDARASVFERLGPREREVLQLIAEGRTTKEVAERLGVAAKTIETHRRNIGRKTGLRSVAELTKYAIREGLTSLDA